MKRYRVVGMDLDSTAATLSRQISESWEPDVQEGHRKNKEQALKWFEYQFGSANLDAKTQNLIELGSAPFSILAFHNNFLRQIRNSFVIGSYYPALTGACTLGERILNHLLLTLRDSYKSTPEYKRLYRKSSFDNWTQAIDTLEAWSILLPAAVIDYRKLSQHRNQAIHFDPATDRNDRALALSAITTLSDIIQIQFGGLGGQPWFIPNTPGVSFIKKEAEEQPFVKAVYLPNCARVGPYHTLELEPTDSHIQVRIQDDYNYEEKEITDEEFADLYRNRKQTV